MIPKSTYKSFFNAIYSVILSKEKSNKTSVEKLASTFGITDKNTIKEITETAIVTIARKIANQQNKSVKQKYNEIVDLYKSQVNLSHRTSQSMLLQQYSTPATIGFLMGIYCKVDQPGNYYEPSAGNGMLTIANSGKDFTVNEIDAIRFQNLEFQDIYKLITRTDSSQETYKSKYFDAIITNPPFATVNKDEYLILGEYEIKHLDHKMAILALNSMRDNGKAAIIVGGHTSWDDKGRIQAGKNRIFLSYLYKNYNVEDIILIDGNALYSKMGTGFDTRIILINGRKPKAEGFAPLKNDVLAQVIKTTDDLYSRFSKNFEKNIAPMKKTLRLRAKAVSIKQKQLLEIGKLGAYVPTPKHQYEVQGASNSYFKTREDDNFIEEDDVLKELNLSPVRKSILGTKKITQKYLRSSFFQIGSEWHHVGDNFKKAYFYERKTFERYNTAEYIKIICNKILEDIEEAKKPKITTVKYFKDGTITVGDYSKSGRRFIYNETKFENVYYSKNSMGGLEIIRNGKLIFQDYNRKNTAIKIDGKEITKATFNKKLKETA